MSNAEVGEISLSVSIMAHPSRKDMVNDLLLSLGEESEGVKVVWDRKNNEWDTGKRSWEVGLSSGASHHLVIQDDVLPCVDMIAGAREALRYVPERDLLSLYLGEAKLGDGRATPRHQNVTRAIGRLEKVIGPHDGSDPGVGGWLITSGPWWGPAFIMPTNAINEMLGFCYGRHEVYDRRLTIWCVDSGRNCWHPYPSFAEHKDEPSLVLPDRPRAVRVARKFIGADASALEFKPRGAVRCR